MNLNWLQENLIYLTKAGSQAYGLANEMSDLDIKGIVIPPPMIEHHLYNRFDQAENDPTINFMGDEFKNPLNPKIESTVYSLRKFFLLAAEVNPNIIELLFTDPKHYIMMTPTMKRLIENRESFLSNKAKFTFSGYSVAQAKKIERHRKWIVLGEVLPPKREDFGLPTLPERGLDEVFGHIKSTVESWNLNQFPLEEMDRAELKNTIWELMSNVTEKEISVSNWPDVYADGVIHKMAKEFSLKDDLVKYIYAERSYAKAKQVYDSWVSWKKERNPDRRALEEKSGYDTKHASHLVRLMRMGYEIITDGKVNVNRTGIDADELLAIKNGSWSFEKVMEFKDEMEAKLDVEYSRQKALIAAGQPTPIPREVDKVKLNAFYHELYDEYWNSPDNMYMPEVGKSPYE